jgi:hypothetical protein
MDIFLSQGRRFSAIAAWGDSIFASSSRSFRRRLSLLAHDKTREQLEHAN